MISNINNQRDTKKGYHLCVRCKSPVYDILKTNDKHDISVTADLNHKRHICTGPERIKYEEDIVKGLQEHIKNINEFELSNFQLWLIMEEAVGT